jgi:phosphate:Na+ symporter
MGVRPYRAYGKAVFYFGLIFLALDLVAEGLAPIAHSPHLAEWHEWLSRQSSRYCLGPFSLHSCSPLRWVSGLSVLLVSQALVSPFVAIWMVAGANVGTTSTALLASSVLDSMAKKLALLNTLFNVLGIVLFVSVLQPIIHLVLRSSI